ncbi:hypothetical protein HDU76_011515, partial [Blyttiomyces sp. JEL0837]
KIKPLGDYDDDAESVLNLNLTDDTVVTNSTTTKSTEPQLKRAPPANLNFIPARELLERDERLSIEISGEGPSAFGGNGGGAPVGSGRFAGKSGNRGSLQLIVKDTGKAKEFESLLTTTDTVKLSSTPDRLKSIEIKSTAGPSIARSSTNPVPPPKSKNHGNKEFNPSSNSISADFITTTRSNSDDTTTTQSKPLKSALASKSAVEEKTAAMIRSKSAGDLPSSPTSSSTAVPPLPALPDNLSSREALLISKLPVITPKSTLEPDTENNGGYPDSEVEDDYFNSKKKGGSGSGGNNSPHHMRKTSEVSLGTFLKTTEPPPEMPAVPLSPVSKQQQQKVKAGLRLFAIGGKKNNNDDGSGGNSAGVVSPSITSGGNGSEYPNITPPTQVSATSGVTAAQKKSYRSSIGPIPLLGNGSSSSSVSTSSLSLLNVDESTSISTSIKEKDSDAISTGHSLGGSSIGGGLLGSSLLGRPRSNSASSTEFYENAPPVPSIPDSIKESNTAAAAASAATSAGKKVGGVGEKKVEEPLVKVDDKKKVKEETVVAAAVVKPEIVKKEAAPIVVKEGLKSDAKIDQVLAALKVVEPGFVEIYDKERVLELEGLEKRKEVDSDELKLSSKETIDEIIADGSTLRRLVYSSIGTQTTYTTTEIETQTNVNELGVNITGTNIESQTDPIEVVFVTLYPESGNTEQDQQRTVSIRKVVETCDAEVQTIHDVLVAEYEEFLDENDYYYNENGDLVWVHPDVEEVEQEVLEQVLEEEVVIDDRLSGGDVNEVVVDDEVAKGIGNVEQVEQVEQAVEVETIVQQVVGEVVESEVEVQQNGGDDEVVEMNHEEEWIDSFEGDEVIRAFDPKGVQAPQEVAVEKEEVVAIVDEIAVAAEPVASESQVQVQQQEETIGNEFQDAEETQILSTTTTTEQQTEIIESEIETEKIVKLQSVQVETSVNTDENNENDDTTTRHRTLSSAPSSDTTKRDSLSPSPGDSSSSPVTVTVGILEEIEGEDESDETEQQQQRRHQIVAQCQSCGSKVVLSHIQRRQRELPVAVDGSVVNEDGQVGVKGYVEGLLDKVDVGVGESGSVHADNGKDGNEISGEVNVDVATENVCESCATTTTQTESIQVIESSTITEPSPTTITTTIATETETTETGHVSKYEADLLLLKIEELEKKLKIVEFEKKVLEKKVESGELLRKVAEVRVDGILRFALKKEVDAEVVRKGWVL